MLKLLALSQLETRKQAKTMFQEKIPWKGLLVSLAAIATVLLLAVSGSIFKLPATAGQSPTIIAEMAPQPIADVWPTDEYYPAVKNLVERYACLTGYPDNTFQPRRVATRGEVA